MKWVADRSRPRFDLFGFKMKVVCKVHILSRFHFFSFLNQTIHLFTQISVFFNFLKQTVHLLIIFSPRSWFFSAFSSKRFIFLPRSRFCSTFSMFFTNIFTSLLIFVLFLFSFLFRWMKWAEDGARPRFDLIGFRMKVVCKVHILSRFHFFQLSQPNSSSFYPDLGFFSAFSSKQFIFLPRSRFCSAFSMFFTSIFTSLLIFVLFLFSFFVQMNEMSRRWVMTKIWFIWFQNESDMWSSSYFYSAFGYFHLMFPSNSILLQTDFSTFVWLFVFSLFLWSMKVFFHMNGVQVIR